MEKIKKIIKNKNDAFVSIGDGRIYMAKLSDRAPVTADTQVLSFRDLFLTVDLLVDKVETLSEEIANIRGEK